MVQKQEENERAKAEAVLQRLDEKEKRLHQKAANKAVKKAREWRNKGTLRLLYIVDKKGGGRLLKRA
jgi:ATP-dependent protease HslVU (ClpYQ) peptidase subunit